MKYSYFLIWVWQFLKEQASLVADEITADSVKDFVSQLDEIEEDSFAEWGSRTAAEKGFSYLDETQNRIRPSSFPFRELTIRAPEVDKVFRPQVNGKANKKIEEVAVSLAGSSKLMINGVAGSFPKPAARNLFVQKEVLASLGIWQAGKVALWHGSEDQSIQWLSVLCFDRKSE